MDPFKAKILSRYIIANFRIEEDEDDIEILTDGGKAVLKQATDDYIAWWSEGAFKNKHPHGLIFETLDVDPNKRRQGIASKLIKKVIEYAKENKYPVIYLNASPTGSHDRIPLPELVALYKKFGFKSVKNQGNNVLMKLDLKSKVQAAPAFQVGKTYDWRDVSRHWQHMSEGGDEGWEPRDAEDFAPPAKLPSVPTWKLVELPLNEIKPHHPCAHYDQEVIEDYRAYRKKSGKPYPPIIVEEKEDTYQTLDGCHRYEAAKQDGDKTIPAFIPWNSK